MNRGSIKKLLFPHIIKHIAFSLFGASLFFIIYLICLLVSTIVNDLQNDDENKHPNNHMSINRGLFYLQKFLLLIIFAILQIFGLNAIIRQNRNAMIIFITGLFLSFIITAIIYLGMDDNDFFSLAIFFLIQALFTYLLILVNKYRNRNVSNIHYIPMPDEDGSSLSRRSFQSSNTSANVHFPNPRF